MFTRAKVGTVDVLALAPLSVLPEYQKKGIGTALIEEEHRIARQLGYRYSVVLGSEKYYPRFGYVSATSLGIIPPFDVADENFMAFNMQQDDICIHGVMEYAEEFGIE